MIAPSECRLDLFLEQQRTGLFRSSGLQLGGWILARIRIVLAHPLLELDRTPTQVAHQARKSSAAEKEHRDDEENHKFGGADAKHGTIPKGKGGKQKVEFPDPSILLH